jgi:hypothetical protein
MYLFSILSIIISISNVYTITPIGGNLDGLRDWSHSLPYVNLIRQSRKWGSPFRPSDEKAPYDPVTGWPKSDFGVVIVSSSFDLGGTYLLHAIGNADVTMADEIPGDIQNKNYNPSTNTLSAQIILPQGASQMRLSFRHTTGPGLQNISILQPGYNLSSQSDITTLMLTHLSRLSTIRFMEWTKTNNNSDVNWNDSTPLYWPQYTELQQNPWETIPLIVNQLNKTTDVWINIPTIASDDYVLKLAELMLKELKSSNTIYIEYSNEVWNDRFPQSNINRLAANDSVYNHGDPYHFNYDNISNVDHWAYRRIASQTKRISDLFKIIFGEENVGQWKRIRPILGGHCDKPIVIMDSLDYLNAIYGSPSNFLHGIAVAPYFYLGKYNSWSNLTTDQVLDGLNSSVQVYLPEQGWSEQAPLGIHAIFAAWYGLTVHGYEGGPGTAAGCGNCSLEAKTNATRDKRMTDICVTYLDGWYRFGFQTINWFNAGASATTATGSYGLLEDMRQETLMDTTKMFNATSPVAQLPRPSPKLKAIDLVRSRSIQLSFGITIPSYNVNATNFMNHSVPYPDPDLRNLQANSTFFYPLQIRQSPIQLNLTVYVSGESGMLEAGINNANFVQVNTPSTPNMTIFEPAPVIQFNINQTTIPSVVTLRLRNIVNGYSIRSFDIIPTT